MATVLALSGRQRPRHRGDVGLPALAIPRVMDRCPAAQRAIAGIRLGRLAVDLGYHVPPASEPPSSSITPCCPSSDHRYRAVFFPGADPRPRNRAALSRRPPASRSPMSIGTMWDGGKHRALRAEPPARADRRQAGARAVNRSRRLARARRRRGVDLLGNLNALPPEFRTVAADAAVQPPFTLDDLRGGNKTTCRLGDPAAAAVLRDVGLGRGPISTPQMPVFAVCGSTGQCNTACSLSAGVSKPKVFRGR